VEIYVLASGSKGNMTYLKTKTERIFIDVGISYKKLSQKMNMFNEDIASVKTLFITHEHSDHTQGLKMLLKQSFIENVFLTKGTFERLSLDIKDMLPKNTTFVKADQAFHFNGFEVMPFMISHDAAEPVGYVLYGEDKKLVFLTDTGYVDESYFPLLSQADFYLLETNHHPHKLMQSPRPFLLRKRIMGERGHLSNDDASYLMNKLVSG
jgi:phosphoribosyl 1,2-cyclic phosphodiesterase